MPHTTQFLYLLNVNKFEMHKFKESESVYKLKKINAKLYLNSIEKLNGKEIIGCIG